MAKQTFTTGQVLTAAQMTSLQQTAMLGGAASAKTASYTLVAADAGTAISMSNAGATTITVNTALFAAGDTVHITNLGAGVCTITAGTATVNSSASLSLAQYESGFLDFTSSSAAIFVKGAGAAASSGGMTLISTTTLTGTSVSLTSIPQTYKDLRLYVRNFKPSVDGWYINLSLNGAGAANTYISQITSNSASNAGTTTAFGNSLINIGYSQDNTTATGLSIIHIADYTNSTTWKIVQSDTIGNNDATATSANYYRNIGLTNLTAAITEIRLAIAGSTYTSGTVLLYGVS